MGTEGRLKLATVFSLMVSGLGNAKRPPDPDELGAAIEELADQDPDFWRYLLKKDQHLAMLFDMLIDEIGVPVSTDPNAPYTCASQERRAEWAAEEAEEAARRAAINAALNACHSG